MGRFSYLKEKAEQHPDRTINFTVNAYSQTNIVNSPAKPPAKRFKPTFTLKQLNACTFTRDDNELVKPAGYRSRVLSERMLWSTNFKKIIRVTALLKEANGESPPATADVMSDIIEAALIKQPTLATSISWLNVADMEVRELTAELQEEGVNVNTNNILLAYFLDYPILYAGWLASTTDKNKAHEDRISFNTPCPLCHGSSPLGIVLDSKLRGHHYPPKTPWLNMLLNEDKLVEHLERPNLGSRPQANLHDNFIYLHTLILEIYKQIKKSHNRLVEAINKDFDDNFPDDEEFKDASVVSAITKGTDVDMEHIEGQTEHEESESTLAEAAKKAAAEEEAKQAAAIEAE